jgi:protein-S-isoprenylcysteine O-methyltransferase Ste14
MAGIALVGWLVFLAVGAGWRSWHQRRLTGDHGFRGLSAPLGSPEQLLGAALFGGAVVSVAAPVLVLAGVLDTWRVGDPRALAALGLMLFGAGLFITVKAQLDMGASWRIGVDRGERTELATRGLYRHARNPIYSGMLLVWAAEALLVPNAVSLAGLALTFVAVELFVRRVEEPHLVAIHGDAYRSYASAVGRFLPGVGRLSASGAPSP